MRISVFLLLFSAFVAIFPSIGFAQDLPGMKPDSYFIVRSISATPDKLHKKKNQVSWKSQGGKQESGYASDNTLLNMSHLKLADIELSGDQTPNIKIPLTSFGQVIFKDWTKNHVGGLLGFYRDGKLFGASPIEDMSTGPLVIVGGLSKEEASQFVEELKTTGLLREMKAATMEQ